MGLAFTQTMNEDREQQHTEDQSLRLWQIIIDHEGTTFMTTGRGSKPGVEFRYEVSRSGGRAGRKYQGTSIPGYGNELWIIDADGQRKKKSISRSTVDLAYRTALEEQERSGFVSGPRKLGVPGVRSNLYAMFVRFGVIRCAPDNGTTDRTTDRITAVDEDAE